MISVEKHGPVSRTYEEDDDDITSQTTQILDFQLIFNNGFVAPQANTLIVGTDNVSSALVPAFIESYRLQKIGSIQSQEIVYSQFYYQENTKLLLLAFEKEIPIESVYSWLKAIMTFNPKFIITIGSMNVSNFIGEREYEGGTLRKIETAKHSEEWKKIGGSLGIIRSLETGNVVTGKVASILSFCEARGIASAALLTITSASLSFNAVKVFEQAWPIFRLLSESGDVVRKPTIQEYNAAIKSNPFLSITENMYC